MTRVKNVSLYLGLIVLIGTTAVLMPRPATAQVTTGSISGVVVDPQGGALPGASVIAVHVPTGTTYETVTQANGRYEILNARVGDSYTVTAKMSGFKDMVRKDLEVRLGQALPLDFKLELQTVSESLTVTAEAPVIDTTQAGAASNVSSAQTDSIPTIARSIIDVLQVNPYFSGYITSGNAQTSFSVAGRNNRYNNIQIDGAVNNDIFGLSATGTPEGQSNAQPISMDVIQEFQLLISPYDVRQGGFSGGGVNIITRSGANAFTGDAFYFGRNQGWVGKYWNPDLATPALSAPTATFSDKQLGASVGGPIRANKVFFFGSSDSQREQTPSGISVDGTSPNFAPSFPGAKAAVDTILSVLQTTYGYNPSGSSGIDPEGQFSKLTSNDKIFGRVDVNLSNTERLTIRNNFVHSIADISQPTAAAFYLPDNYYRFLINTNSTVGQLNSTLGGGRIVNELRVASTEIRNHRGGEPFEQAPFPNVTVTIAPGITVVAGRDNSSTANQLFQDDVEFNDDLTMVRGNHTFTVGTHDEFFHFQNLFIQNTFGKYTFTSLANFQAGLAQSYNYNFSNTGNPLQEADFRVSQFGFYAGDQWRAGAHVTVTYGARLDLPRFNHVPNPNPLSVTDFGLGTNVVPAPTQFSPRVGVNWDPIGDGKKQIRAGVGIFSGRTPYVWLSNQYSNNGVDFSAISIASNANNKIPFVANPTNQPLTPSGGSVATSKQTLNLVDPNFKFPSQLRGNVAFDTNLPWGMVGTAEVMFSKTLEEILYKNLNLTQTGTSALDGRPIFTTAFSTLGPTLLLTNSTEGHGASIEFQVRRPFRHRFAFDVGYLYGVQKSQEESGSSVALTSWSNTYATNTSNPPLTTSDFDPGHRVTADVSYQIPIPGRTTATLSMFYSGESGHPYSLAYSFDANGDAQNFNDLLYMAPQSAPLAYTGNGATYSTLLNFFQQLGTCATNQIGSIFARNSCRAPWVNTLNGRIAVGLPVTRLKVDLTLDMLNMLNLLNDHWGLTRFVNFNEIDVVNPTTTAGTVTSLNLSTINPTTGSYHPFAIDDLRSRWELQAGVRVKF